MDCDSITEPGRQRQGGDMERDFVGYGPQPPAVTLPGGARLAVNLVINYEEGAELTPAEGDDTRERMSEASYTTNPGQRELLQESIYEFGSRAGVWRILRTLDEFDAVATVFVSAVALERNPLVAKAFVERGYDMVGHGFRWVQHLNMSEEEERQAIRKAVASVEALTGQRMTGWFTSPLPSQNTRRILVEEAFTFDSDSFADDIAYYVPVDDRWHLVVPYTLDVNDIRFWKDSLFTADDWFQYARDCFDTLHAEGADIPRMMSVGLHCRVIGRPARIGALRRFLAHVRQHDDVWICRRTDLADHWLKQCPPPTEPPSRDIP
jgi:allantoinase